MQRAILAVGLLLACKGGGDKAAGTGTGDGSGTGTGTDDTATADDTGDGPGDVDCPDDPGVPDLDDTWSLAATAPGGDLFYLIEAPSEPGRIYGASSMNGLYRSDDGGQVWEKLNTDITHVSGQVAVHPTEPHTVAYTTGALYFSSDGLTFERSEHGDEGDEEQSFHGLLFTEDAFFAIAHKSRVYRSDDGGHTLDELATIQAKAPPPHDTDSSKFELSETWWYLAWDGDRLWAAQETGGLYRSDDEGQSWVEVHGGPFHVGTLTVDGPAVWAGGAGTLVRATATGLSDLGSDGLELHAIAVDRGQLHAMTDDTVYRLSEADVLEEWGSPPDAHNLRHAIGLSLGDMVLVHRDGAWRSSDGATWEDSSEGLAVSDLGPLLPHPTCPSLVWVGTQCERGMFRSEDYGADLAYVDEYFHYVMVPRAHPVDPAHIWIASDNFLKRSTDLGQTWEQLGADTLKYHLHGLDLHPTDADIALAGTVGSGLDADETGTVYRTEDGGQTWTESGAGLPDTEASAHALHFVRSAPEIVLLGTFRGGDYTHSVGDPGIGLYRSTDGGSSWELADLDASDVPILAECEGTIFAAADTGLFKSEDAGATWTVILEDTPFLTVACHEQQVLSMSERTIFRSDDLGESWDEWGEGLDSGLWPTTMMPQVAFGAEGTIVYAAIPQEGLLRRPW